MSAKPNEKETNVSLRIPTQVRTGDLPAKIYVTFEEDSHKIALNNTFPNYERTAVAKELAEFWFPEVIDKFREAMSEGKEKVIFTLG